LCGYPRKKESKIPQTGFSFFKYSILKRDNPLTPVIFVILADYLWFPLQQCWDLLHLWPFVTSSETHCIRSKAWSFIFLRQETHNPSPWEQVTLGDQVHREFPMNFSVGLSLTQYIQLCKLPFKEIQHLSS